MYRSSVACFAAAAIALIVGARLAVAQPYYARGDFYSGTAGLWGADAGNQLHDDGAHDDGAAGDGVYGGTVICDQPAGIYDFKIANHDWTSNWPGYGTSPLSNARLITAGVGDAIHFRLDLNPVAGWQPEQGAVACDHGMPAGTVLELMGSAPEIGSWTTPIPSSLVNGVWSAIVIIANAGDYEFKFRNVGNWDWSFGRHYNMLVGENFRFTTTGADATVLFQFDATTGRGYAGPADLTEATRSSWGQVKMLYR